MRGSNPKPEKYESLQEVLELAKRTETEDLKYEVHQEADPDAVKISPLDVGDAAKQLEMYFKLLNDESRGAKFGEGRYEAEARKLYTNPDLYHTFMPSETLINLMMLTDNNNLFARPLPFPHMVIPISYAYKGTIFYGMYAYTGSIQDPSELTEVDRTIMGSLAKGRFIVLYTVLREIVLEKGKVLNNDRLYFQIFDSDGRKQANQDMRPSGYKFREWDAAAKAFANLFFNLVDFLNHPDVEYKVHKHDENVNAKRQARGKPRIPPQILIRVTGKTQRYLDAVKSMGARAKCSHAFWVRGHFRHLTSDRYKNKKGVTIWVAPFIKGDQELIKKAYALSLNR